jgi:NAD(P)-dependent dehydrogenase (short-subunit alcohol dehydrogenase family)
MTRRTALITGGSAGIGRAVAIALARCGHRVAVTGRDPSKLDRLRSEIGGVLALRADVSSADDMRDVLAQVTDSLGPIDVLVNNAGTGGGAAGPRALLDMDPEEWWRVLEVNLRGPMLYSKAVLPGMVERRDGIIINIGSYIAIRASALATAYAASKAALARLTDCLACEVAEHGVHVFCVSPGLVLTDMTRDLPFIRDIPQSEFFQPEDMAGIACKLVTGDYGALSGRFLHVGDDLEALRAEADRIEEDGLYQLRLPGLDGLID